jgi:hypothetical protein
MTAASDHRKNLAHSPTLWRTSANSRGRGVQRKITLYLHASDPPVQRYRPIRCLRSVPARPHALLSSPPARSPPAWCRILQYLFLICDAIESRAALRTRGAGPRRTSGLMKRSRRARYRRPRRAPPRSRSRRESKAHLGQIHLERARRGARRRRRRWPPAAGMASMVCWHAAARWARPPEAARARAAASRRGRRYAAVELEAEVVCVEAADVTVL